MRFRFRFRLRRNSLEAEQIEAAFREWRERNDILADVMPLSRRREMTELYKRGASDAEMTAWLEAKIAQHLAEAEAIQGNGRRDLTVLTRS
jgi:hypothetical protein